MQITTPPNISISAVTGMTARLAALAFSMSCSLLLAACQTTTPDNTSSSTPSTGTSAARVPFLNEEGQEGYRSFLGKSGNRAFFVAADGSWGWRSSRSRPTERVQTKAYWNCQFRTNSECHLYADQTGVVLPENLAAAINPVPASRLPVFLDVPTGWQRRYIVEDGLLIGPSSFSFVTAIQEDPEYNRASISAFLKVRQSGQSLDDWRKTYTDRRARRETDGEPYSVLSDESAPVSLPGGHPAKAHLLTFTVDDARRYLSSLTFETGGFQFLLTVSVTRSAETGRRLLHQQIIPALRLKTSS